MHLRGHGNKGIASAVSSVIGAAAGLRGGRDGRAKNAPDASRFISRDTAAG